MPDIYSFNSHLEFIRAVIENHKESWGMKSRLARAAGCQRSYFSQVLSGDAMLTLDHAAGIMDFLKLDGEGGEHFLDLVNLDRAQSSLLKRVLLKRLERRKAEQGDLTRRFAVPSIQPSSHQQLYYSAWYWSAIHILTGIKGYQALSSIAKKLSLPEPVVSNVLKGLEEMGLVTNKSHVWEVTKGTIHLSRESPLGVIHHSIWRQLANQDVQLGSKESLHYTSVQSISKKDFSTLRTLLTKTIDDFRTAVGNSGKEEIVCLSCDFFEVGF